MKLKMRKFPRPSNRLLNTVFCALLILLCAWSIADLYSHYELSLQSPVHFQNFFKVTYRSPIGNTVILQAKASNTPLTDVQQYICDKFGSDCKMALAVAKAENGTWQCDRFGINTNGTIDVGVFQINSIHLKKGYTLTDLTDCHKNVDIAYSLYKAQGWSPWVAYNNKAYLKFMY